MNYIYSSINNDQLEFVCDEDTAFGIINKFDQLYLKESTALQICIRNKLDKLKLKDYEDSNIFFTDFEKTINELKSAGGQVTEQEKLNYMLRTLPDSLSYIGDLIDAIKKEERNCEFLKSKITMWEVKMKSDASKKKASAFKAENRQKETCYGCNKPGHIIKNCNRPWRRGCGRSRPSGAGMYRPGGVHNQQISQQQPSRGWGGRGHIRRGYNYRGLGRQTRRENNTTEEHDAKYSYSEQRDTGSFLTQIMSNENIENNVETYNSSVNKIDWILDSGCSDHIVNDDSYFSESLTLKNAINVKVGDGRTLKGTKVGKVCTYFFINRKRVKITISNVFYVKDMDKNLISFAKVTDKNKIISIDQTAKIYDKFDNLIGIAYKDNGLYKMSSFINERENYNTETENSVLTQKEKLHRILGHINFNYLDHMCKKQLADGLPNELESIYLKCGTCLKNKMHNLPFKNNRTRANDILELVHSDLNGPHKTTGFDGSKYFLSFVDDYSKLAVIYTINSKSEVYECFKNYINKVENLTGKKIKKFRCDNGKEYLNKYIYELANEKGISIEPCPPYVHELNGVAEKLNRTIMNSARCLLYEANVNLRYWPEVIRTATYLKNRTFTKSTIEDKTPFEIFFGKRPDLSNLKLFGSKVFIRVPEEKRESKWDRKADVGILLGYENVGYRVLINGRIAVARHVDIVEDRENLVGFSGDDNESCSESEECYLDNKSQGSDSDVFTESVGKKNVSREDLNEGKEIKKTQIRKEQRKLSEETNKSKNNLRRTGRERKKTEFYSASLANTKYIYVNFVSADSPTNYVDVLESDEYCLWKEAMDGEINSLMKNKTWELVEKPENVKVLDTKWVFTNKSDNRKKARLVVRGFQQSEVLEDLYSPVARIQTLKLLLSYCCQNELNILQLDVETAFLNDQVMSEVYVKQPLGYADKTGRVCKLKKALYGLRESPRAWYECFDKYIKKLGFVRSESDYCLYMNYEDKDKIYLIIFVEMTC